MGKKLKLNAADITGIIVLLVLLVAVRIWQDALFYDPLIQFYKTDAKVLPEFDTPRLCVGLLFRYAINTLLSLCILWLIFKDRQVVKLSALLYGVFFLVLISAFFFVISAESPNQLVLFYVRRFLIQPLFLILFIPAFYYQKKV